MDCNEKGMFHTNDSEYNEFLGIGKPQGFLGLKKLFNTKGYQNSLAQSKTNLQSMSSIMSAMNLPSSKAPVSTQSTAWTWNGLIPTSPFNTNASNLQSGRPLVFAPSSFSLNDVLDTAIVIAKNKAQQGTTKTETKEEKKEEKKEETTTTTTQPVVGTTTDDKGYSKDPRGNDVKPDRTMLYVGIAGAGILLISGIAFMASKGK